MTIGFSYMELKHINSANVRNNLLLVLTKQQFRVWLYLMKWWCELIHWMGGHSIRRKTFRHRDWRVRHLEWTLFISSLSPFSGQGWTPWQKLKSLWETWGTHHIAFKKKMKPQVTQIQGERGASSMFLQGTEHGVVIANRTFFFFFLTTLERSSTKEGYGRLQ